MVIKKLNLALLYGSRLLNFLIILYFAVLLAKSVWWLISPGLPGVYVGKTEVNQFDNSVKYVANRYPFGVITLSKGVASAVLPIAQQITLTGVYVNPPKDSMAFIEYNKKHMVVRIGGVIDSNAMVTAITQESITITQGDGQASIAIKGVAPATNGSKPIYNPDLNNTSHGSAPAIPAMNSNQPQPSPSQNNQLSSGINNNIGLDPNSPEFREQRKRLIEEFAERGHEQNDASGPTNNNQN